MKNGFVGILILLVGLFFAGLAKAAVSDFAEFFDIDLEKDELPTKSDLDKALEEKSDYDRKYGSFYDLLGEFDRDFYVKIAAYGIQEKRLKGVNEDFYMDFLNSLPKKYYQYVGPQLFEIPNMSEKVLNLPGIKETKNKFPTRIAEQVKDIENLEFMSPMYYYLLMPEAWPGFESDVEKPKMTPYFPRVRYDKNFYAVIKKLVKPEKYMPGYEEKAQKSKSDLRTVKIDKNSLLTAADIAAFVETIDRVDDWANKPENQYLLAAATILWANYQQNDELGKYVPGGLIDLVNPCSRFVQKTRIMGKEREVAMLVADKGFTLNEWAYTCDKTIKAYKVLNIRNATLTSLRQFQRGLHDDKIENISDYSQNMRHATMMGVIEAHKAPLSDVLEYKQNREVFENKLKNKRFRLFGVMVMTH